MTIPIAFHLGIQAKVPAFPAPTANTAGLKTLRAVGSITGGTNSLVLTSNPGFQVGDNIIIAVGHEAGAGMRGTRGVGGVWPALSYADATAMNADATQADNTFAWLESTGLTYRYVSDVWTIVQNGVDSYYVEKAVPRALLAAITAVVGTTLTLDTTATVTATNADVYFDNEAILNALINEGAPTPLNNTVTCPAGAFAISQRLRIAYQPGLLFEGQGVQGTEFFNPAGCAGGSLQVLFSPSARVRNFTLRGNVGDNGYGLRWDVGAVTETDIPQGLTFPKGIYFEHMSNPDGVYNASDIKVINVFQYACGASISDDLRIARIQASLTVPLQHYIQWQFDWADSTNCKSYDCSFESAYLAAGFEIFRSLGCQHIRPRTINGSMATNSAGYWKFISPHITVTPEAQFSQLSFSKDSAIMGAGANIGGDPLLAYGGEIRNPIIIQEGYLNENNDVLTSILIDAPAPNITISGGYPDNQLQGGLVQSPPWISPSGLFGIGIISTAENTTVNGIRVSGHTKDGSGWSDIHLNATTGHVTNCVADTIFNNGTSSGNQNNATWVASHP